MPRQPIKPTLIFVSLLNMGLAACFRTKNDRGNPGTHCNHTHGCNARGAGKESLLQKENILSLAGRKQRGQDETPPLEFAVDFLAMQSISFIFSGSCFSFSQPKTKDPP
jgi:hypothetical protein